MPKIQAKRIRVKDPETGIWHDLPAVVSEESFLAAERAAGSAADAAAKAGEAAEAAAEAAVQKDLAVLAAETAEGHSLDAEAYGAGTRGGEPVESGDAAYENNAKYWSGQSSGYADDAADSAAEAEAWATGGTGGTPGAENNAEYWAGQAEAAAEDIEDSAAQIAENAEDIDKLEAAIPSITLDYCTSLQSGDDLDDLTTPGTAYANTNAIAQSILNKPDDVSYQFKIYTIATTAVSSTLKSKRMMQILIENRSGIAIYKRFLYDGDWASWKKEASKSDITSAVDSLKTELEEEIGANTALIAENAADIDKLEAAIPSITLDYCTVLKSGDNLNALTTAGVAYCTSSAIAQSILNKPDDVSYQFKIYTIATTVVSDTLENKRMLQILIENRSAIAIYKRFLYIGSWSAWKKEASTSDIDKLGTKTPAITLDYCTVLQSGDDLNDLTTPGTAYANTNAIAQSILNKPDDVSYQFKVYTIATTNDSDTLSAKRMIQIMIVNASGIAIYKRFLYNGSWSSWKKEATVNDITSAVNSLKTELEAEISAIDPMQTEYRVLIIGDSYSDESRTHSKWQDTLGDYLNIDDLVSLGVQGATLKDRYTNRTTYPYTSRPDKNTNTGNLNTFMCQIQKLKRLMAGVDLDTGETALYQSEADYPNVIIIEGGQNDSADTDEAVAGYTGQFLTVLSDVYVKETSSTESATLGTACVKTPLEDADRTTFAGAYRSLVEELQAIFPRAQIFATSRSMITYWRSDILLNVRKIREQQQTACAMCGIDFIDWQGGTQINLMKNYPTEGSGTQADPYIYGEISSDVVEPDTYDMLHPTALGAAKYAKVVANYIRTHFLGMEDF